MPIEVWDWPVVADNNIDNLTGKGEGKGSTDYLNGTVRFNVLSEG